MTGLTRRVLLGRAAIGAAGLAAARLPDSVLDALAAPRATGTWRDIEHVVFLVQENRSFDHYFGTLRGVRGFDDAAAAGALAQPGFDRPGFGGRLMPFHLDAASGTNDCVSDPTHDWEPQHRSWNGGRMDGFVRTHMDVDGDVNGPVTMGYYKRADLPFYHALADAFTICDGYHCSAIGPSYCNQSYLISATMDPAGKAGGPLINDGTVASLSWRTMPEALQAAGISWRVYTSADNYTPNAVGDPVFHFFRQYLENPALATRAFGNLYPGQFELDCALGTLPQVSWVYAPVVFAEHPPAPVNSGEGSTARVLGALTANPELWARTALFVVYDENGGFYDHVAPPTPPPGTPGEELTVNPLPASAGGVRGPIGMGFRVPLIVCSPFTRGGYLCSDTFDHTSLLRFLERRFGVEVPNLTAWRRQTAGDLSAVFGAPDGNVPALPDTQLLGRAVSAECILTLAGSGVSALGPPVTVPPNSVPQQEPGSRPRRSGSSPPAAAPKPKPRRRHKRRRRHRRRHHPRRHHRRRHHRPHRRRRRRV
jgi:phospholipase C